MKKSFLILLIFLSSTLVLNANMASPIRRGTLVANPFLNNYVSVLHENILITLNDANDFAKFNIEYIINSEKDGINIPLLFYAFGYSDNFTVFLDGKKIDLKKFKDFWNKNNLETNHLTNFNYLYTNDVKELASINISFDNDSSDTLQMKDFIYFETDLSKGKHTIKVSYNANAWIYKHRRLNETSYKYALSPAKYWKSYGTLDLKIDVTNFSRKINTNLGYLVNGNLETTAIYHFEKMPVDVITINIEPNLSAFAKFLLKIEDFFLALIFMLPLFFLHLKLMHKYRKANPKKWLSPIAIIGGFLLPFVFIFMLIISNFFIDYFLGAYASGRASYGAFYSFFFLPKYILFYLLLSLLVDFVFSVCKKTL